MTDSGMNRVMGFLMVCGLLVSGFLVVRLSKLDPVSLVPPSNFKEAVKNYRSRVRATERLLQREQL
ncbi:MAG: hypothetical protein ABIK43_02125 [candidate division WOR-3 bacterium]